jgi:hypothetical protein
MNGRVRAALAALLVLASGACNTPVAPSQAVRLTVATSPAVFEARVRGSSDAPYAFDVTTGSDGRVAIWMPVASRQASLVITAPGWAAQAVMMAVAADGSTVVTFPMMVAQ